MATVKLEAGRKVRLPDEAVRKLGLRKGARLNVHVSGDLVVLVPAGRVPKDQRYFWTEEWLKKEREADEAIARGDVLGPFEDVEVAIQALRTAKA